MPTATVFSRGRITLPREGCRDLGIGPGSKIDFVENEDGETVIIPRHDDARVPEQALKEDGSEPTPDQFNTLAP